jgi:NAD(P)H-dependent FMN reductase
MPTVKLLFVAGSTRVGSLNARLARAAAATAERQGHPATVVDLADYPMPLYDGDIESLGGPPEAAHRLLDVMATHAGVFLASPEYNASMSPLLKNSIDWMSRVRTPEPSGLAVLGSRVFALGAASPGGTGGMRGLIGLRYCLEMGLSALVLPEQVLVARATAAFDDDGALRDPEAADRLGRVVARLADVAGRVHA